MTLGQKIKQLRLAKELSQPQLSLAMGIEQSYLSKLENDKAFPSDEMFNTLLTAFDVELESFIADFEQDYIKSHLSKLSLVNQLFSAQEKRSLSFMMRWIIVSALLIVVGGTALTGGIYEWFFKPVWTNSHLYESKGVIKQGESFRLFAESNGEGFPDHLALRLEHKVIEMKQDSGRYFVKQTADGNRLYTRMRRQNNHVDNSNNHWLAAIGLCALLTGVVGLIVESKVRRLHRLSN